MVGIKSYGVHIPFYRLKRAEISNSWQSSSSPRGERTVANFDEDSLTMAVAAGIDCLKHLDRKKVDGVFCTSTTYPYREKLTSAVVSAALDLREGVRVADFCSSLRGGTIAMGSAIDAISAGSSQSVLVTASDCRLGAPGGDLEQSMGDGGAALLFGKDELIAEVEHRYTIGDEFCGMWRTDEDKFVRIWEDRMVHDEGYSKMVPKAIKAFLSQSGLAIKDFNKIVVDVPADLRRHPQLAKELGISKEQLQDPLNEFIGNTGSALATMMLVAALEEAKPKDRILWASYSNGVDVYSLRVTENILKVKNRGTFSKQLNTNKNMIFNYATYLKWRSIVPTEEARRPAYPATSIANLKRNAKILLSLYGVKCKKCGTPQYTQAGMLSYYIMPERICIQCGAKDEFEDYCFADKKGKIFSYTQDMLATTQDPPLTIAIVDFEGGGRGAFEVTDRDPKKMEVGMPVEMTFRHLFLDRGIHNYYWKAKPTRE